MKRFLITGNIIEFGNEDGEMMELSFRKTWGGSMQFICELNGKVVKMCKTFEAFERKVQALCKERDLKRLTEFSGA